MDLTFPSTKSRCDCLSVKCEGLYNQSVYYHLYFVYYHQYFEYIITNILYKYHQYFEYIITNILYIFTNILNALSPIFCTNITHILYIITSVLSDLPQSSGVQQPSRHQFPFKGRVSLFFSCCLQVPLDVLYVQSSSAPFQSTRYTGNVSKHKIHGPDFNLADLILELAFLLSLHYKLKNFNFLLSINYWQPYCRASGRPCGREGRRRRRVSG